MDLDVKVELEKQVKDVTALDAQLQQLQAQRKSILEELYRRQGIIQYLQRLNGENEPKAKVKNDKHTTA